jgi:hypothetical protein
MRSDPMKVEDSKSPEALSFIATIHSFQFADRAVLVFRILSGCQSFDLRTSMLPHLP